jgi:hypothetical protein
MNRKMVLAGLAALTVAASAAPAAAQGFAVGVGFGDSGYNDWYGDYGYYRPGVGVSVGFGAPGWGYNDWSYGSYAAAPCTCATRYRTTRVVAPRYRSYAYGGYPYDNSYSYYPYDYSYGGSYASVGLGWSDEGWRDRRWRDRDRFTREDRVRVSNRNFRDGRDEFRDRRSGISRASVRTSGTRSMSRGAEFRGGANGEFRGGANAEFRGGARGEIGGSAGRGGAATIGTGNGERRGGDNR